MSSDVSPQSPKMIIVTAAITAITSLGISFIGIFPQLRQGDVNKISDLQTTISKLGSELKGLLKGDSSSGEKWTISGRVESAKGRAPLKAAELYLIPSTGSDLMMITGDEGEFIFDKVTPGTYWLVMRNPIKDGASRVLIPIKREDGSNSLKEKFEVKGTTLTYGIANK
jgi:hypothetical protein